MKYLDRFLNSITMYRLLLYGLAFLGLISVVFGFLGILSFGGMDLIFSAVILLIVCNLADFGFAKIFKMPVNVESASITALILFFILMPGLNFAALQTFLFAGVVAMLSKYLLSFQKRQFFNPAAIAAVVLGFSGSFAVIWWIGSAVLLPFVLIFGFMVVRKIRRMSLFLAYLVASLAVMVAFGIYGQQNLFSILSLAVVSGPLIFFGTVMLTEPLTTPPTRKFQIIYGVLVGVLANLHFNFWFVFSTPELALVLGNLFSWSVSFKQKLFLTLESKTQLGPWLYEFNFAPKSPFNFQPGQYLEWTLAHKDADQRGIRRFFTIASSPTEKTVKLAVKISDQGSSFKKKLLEMKNGDQLYVANLGGEFQLPNDNSSKLVFIAGGIGVTPFRSMVQYLIDKNLKTDIVFFYVCNSDQDFVYTELFDRAVKEIGLKMVYVVSNPDNCAPAWQGKKGYITKEMISEMVPDLEQRFFYLSGPDAMVQNYKKLLFNLKIKPNQIKTDYFPGF